MRSDVWRGDFHPNCIATLAAGLRLPVAALLLALPIAGQNAGPANASGQPAVRAANQAAPTTPTVPQPAQTIPQPAPPGGAQPLGMRPAGAGGSPAPGQATNLARAMGNSPGFIGPRAPKVIRRKETLRIPRRYPLGFVLDVPMAAAGDRVILLSEVDQDLLSNAQLRNALAGNLHRRDILQALTAWERQTLQKLLDEVTFAQAIYTLDPNRRQMLAQHIEQHTQAQEAENIRALGGVLRWHDELQRGGATPEEQRQRERERQMAMFMMHRSPAAQDGGAGFAVTPAEMRRFYDENLDLFHRAAQVNLAWIRFRTEAQAQEAAALWAKEPVDLADPKGQLDAFAARWPGTVSDLELQPRGEDNRAAWLLAFGRDAANGEVSAPVPLGSGFFLARVIYREDEVHEEFGDRVVQDKIRRILQNRHEDQMRTRNLARYARASVSWSPILGRQ